MVEVGEVRRRYLLYGVCVVRVPCTERSNKEQETNEGGPPQGESGVSPTDERRETKERALVAAHAWPHWSCDWSASLPAKEAPLAQIRPKSSSRVSTLQSELVPTHRPSPPSFRVSGAQSRAASVCCFLFVCGCRRWAHFERERDSVAPSPFAALDCSFVFSSASRRDLPLLVSCLSFLVSLYRI